MKLAVPTETRPGERRVSLVPDVVKKLVGSGWEVAVQAGAGAAASYPDAAFAEAGATVAPDVAATLAGAGLVVKVNAPDPEEAARLPEGAALLSFFGAAQSPEALPHARRTPCNRLQLRPAAADQPARRAWTR